MNIEATLSTRLPARPPEPTGTCQATAWRTSKSQYWSKQIQKMKIIGRREKNILLEDLTLLIEGSTGNGSGFYICAHCDQ